MNSTLQIYFAYNKIVKTIESCETHEQLKNSYRWAVKIKLFPVLGVESDYLFFIKKLVITQKNYLNNKTSKQIKDTSEYLKNDSN